MPNYVINKLHLSGEQSRIDELLKSVKGEESSIDFNKIIPMPESLNIESGSRTYNGLKAYRARKDCSFLCPHKRETMESIMTFVSLLLRSFAVKLTEPWSRRIIRR